MIFCVGLNPAIDRVLKVDDFSVGTHAKAELLSSNPAGKATNVARVLASLGQKATLCGFVGSGEEKLFAESFNSENVDVKLSALDNPTRINTTIIDSKNRIETHLREAGAEVGEDDFVRFRAFLLGEVCEGDIVAFCGSLPPGVKAADVGHMMADLSGAGVKVAADCNGEMLNFLPDSGMWALKPNREELSELLNIEISSHEELLDVLRKSDICRELNIENILISDGEYGAGLIGFGDNKIWAEPVKVEVVSTVGAGDAAFAGFISAMAQDIGGKDALAMAVCCGAGAVAQRDAGVVDVSMAQTSVGNCHVFLVVTA
jgi:1-phosphofructokinase